MNSVIQRIVGFVTAVACLVMVWSWGWQSGWSTTADSRGLHSVLKKTAGNTRQISEQQASFSVIQGIFGDPQNTTIANTSSPVYSVEGSASNLSLANHSSATIMIPSGDNKTGVATVPTSPPVAPVKGCGAPRQNIVFFKMHKCSSSTIQNILMRYGDAHDLTFVLPPRGNYLGHSPFTRAAMFDFKAREYNILCHHTRFNFEGMSGVMPKDSVWTSIIRDPIDMFESSFYYRVLQGAFKLQSQSDPLAAFSLDPASYVAKYGHKDFAQSPMLYDLGLPNDKRGNVEAVKTFIAKLDKHFDLVLITEFFEESLILLKELMCWELDDIVYFVVNARAKNSVHTVAPDVRARLESWNVGDVLLYGHFNRTFWAKVEAFGRERMHAEVSRLRTRNAALQARCIIDPERTVNKGGVWHPGGINVKGLVVKPGMESDPLCVAMARAELKFTAYLLQKQKKKFGFG